MEKEIQNEIYYFAFAAILFLIIIAIIMTIFCKNFKLNKKNIKIYGVLLNLNTMSLISISAMTIYYLFSVFCMISFHGMNLIYLSIFLILVLISEVVIDNFKELPISIGLALTNACVIHIVYLIYDYITQENFSYLLLIILFLVILFVFLYNTYTLMKNINNIIIQNKYLVKKKKYKI